MTQTPSQTMLMKVCRTCGLQKPLSAFLQLSNQGGLAYGNICATCRNTQKDQRSTAAESEVSGTRTGLKIDAKLKTQVEADQRLLNKRVVETNKLERTKQVLTKGQRIQKVQQKARQERSHREGFLQRKLAAASKAVVPAQTAATKAIFAAEQKRKTGDVNYSVEQVDMTRQGQLEKHRSPEFRRLQQWLGNSAFVRNIQKMKLTQVTAATPASTPTNKPFRGRG